MSNSKPTKVASYGSIVGSVIANYRKNKGIGQAEISSNSNLSQATWSRIERGTTAVNVSQLSEISALLNISPSQIISEADMMVEELINRGIEVTHYTQKDNDTMFFLGATALIGLAAIFMGGE